MSTPDSTRRWGWLMLLLGWALAFFMVTGFYLMVEQRQYNPNVFSVISAQDGELVLEKNIDGQYLVEGEINGEAVVFLVDTGATSIAVPQAVAERVGLPRLSAGSVQTAAGSSHAWRTQVNELKIGFLVFSNIKGIIVPEMEIDAVLLGMNALQHLEISQTQGRLKLRPIPQE